MLEKLKKLDTILCLLVILSLNSLRDINVAQAIVALGIFAVVGYNRWMDHIKKPDAVQELRDELDRVKNNMSGLMVKSSAKAEPTTIKRFF